MEAFSLLNYWKTNGASSLLPHSSDSSSRYSPEATTIVTSVTEDETDDDEGPFFDLEFALPLEEEECEFNFTLSSCSGEEEEDRVDPEVEDEAEPQCNGTEQTCSVKAPAAQLSASILKSATKLRVFMLGMKKPKLIQAKSEANSRSRESPESQQKSSVTVKNSKTEDNGKLLKLTESQRKDTVTVANSKNEDNGKPKPPLKLTESQQKSLDTVANSRNEVNDKPLKLTESQQNSKNEDNGKVNPPPLRSTESQTVTVNLNLKVEEVPIISLFTRDNSSKNSTSSSSSSSTSSTSLKKQNANESVVLEENRFVMVQKYLKKVKPLYVRVSNLRHSGSLTRSTESKGFKPGNININIPAGLKVVRKHLGKSRSSSSTTVTTTSPVSVMVGTNVTESRRRDDSLLQQQDSIQSAILHCKRSFNSPRDKDSTVLPRSVSEPSSYDK